MSTERSERQMRDSESTVSQTPDVENSDAENSDAENSGWEELKSAAFEARQRAHAPYSNYRVGAALRTADGRIYLGCNVENASYGLTICAERVAIGNAIAHGAKEFVAIAVAVGGTKPATPCGACRQVLDEFMPKGKVRCYAEQTDAHLARSVRELLPDSFNADALDSDAGALDSDAGTLDSDAGTLDSISKSMRAGRVSKEPS